MNNALKIIKATPEHVSIIYFFITQLAIYEKMESEVISTESSLHEHLFERKSAYCILAFENEVPVGFALYFYNYSTFLGKKGLYLEDLFVLPSHRSKGYGKALLIDLIRIAIEENCGRMEWSVLNWNTPAIEFYEKLGAKPMEEWTVFRLTEKIMKDLI